VSSRPSTLLGLDEKGRGILGRMITFLPVRCLLARAAQAGTQTGIRHSRSRCTTFPRPFTALGLFLPEPARCPDLMAER